MFTNTVGGWVAGYRNKCNSNEKARKRKIQMLINIVSSLIGGLLALCGVIIAESFYSKREKAKWIRETKADLFFDLITQLESIDIPIIIGPENGEQGSVVDIDAEAISEKLELLSDYISKNTGRLFVLLPNNLYSELMHLRAELYKSATTTHIDIMHIKETELWKTITHAKTIVYKLKEDLLK